MIKWDMEFFFLLIFAYKTDKKRPTTESRFVVGRTQEHFGVLNLPNGNNFFKLSLVSNVFSALVFCFVLFGFVPFGNTFQQGFCCCSKLRCFASSVKRKQIRV